MAKTFKAKSGEVVSFELGFEGIADYRVRLYVHGPSGWVLLRVLADRCSSEDARPDTFSFKAPPANERVMAVVDGTMTAMDEPATLRVTLTGKVGDTKETEQITTDLNEGDGSKPFAIKMIVEAT